MNDSKLLNKVITISGEETKQTQYGLNKKIKDEKGLTYNIYDKTSKGTESVAWTQYKDLKIGDTVQIGYVEEDKEYQGKKYVARTIRNFNKDIGEGVKQYQSSQPVETPRTGHSGASSEAVDWNKLGYIKAYHNLIGAYISKGETYDQLLEHISNGHLWSLCKTIEEDVTQRTAKGWEAARNKFGTPEVPTIDAETMEPVTTDDGIDIPF